MLLWKCVCEVLGDLVEIEEGLVCVWDLIELLLIIVLLVLCLYLDMVNFVNLDFDFEKWCVVLLLFVYVYVCLVCGKYFVGWGKKMYVYVYVLECGYYVFMCLVDGAAWCLLDGYEVVDEGMMLLRIWDVFVLMYVKKYVEEEIEGVWLMWWCVLDGMEFFVGVVGLNAIWSKRDDGVSAVL